MFEGLGDTAKRYMPPVLLAAALSGAAAYATNLAIDYSHEGGVAGLAANSADKTAETSIGKVSSDLDANKATAAEGENKKYEAALASSATSHANVDSFHHRERAADVSVALLSAAIGVDVAVISKMRKGKG